MQKLSTVALQWPRIHPATYCLHPAHLGRWSTMTTCKVLQLCLCIWFCPSSAPPPPASKHSLTTNWELQDMLVSFQIAMESMNYLCRSYILRLHICLNTKKNCAPKRSEEQILLPISIRQVSRRLYKLKVRWACSGTKPHHRGWSHLLEHDVWFIRLVLSQLHPCNTFSQTNTMTISISSRKFNPTHKSQFVFLHYVSIYVPILGLQM